MKRVSSPLPVGRKLAAGFAAAGAFALVMGSVAPAHAAVINVGSSSTTFSRFVDSQDKADNLTATSGADALAQTNDDGIFGKSTSSFGGFLGTPQDGNDHVIIYQFQANPGALITDADITSSLYASSHDGGGSVTAEFSTDGTNYTQFASVSEPADNGSDAATDYSATNLDLGVGSPNLFLRYALNRGEEDNGQAGFTQLFRSRGDFAGDTSGGGDGSKGFIADLTVVPEPASLALLGLGGLAMIGRRRRRA